VWHPVGVGAGQPFTFELADLLRALSPRLLYNQIALSVDNELTSVEPTNSSVLYPFL
jgi:hypothetical protein